MGADNGSGGSGTAVAAAAAYRPWTEEFMRIHFGETLKLGAFPMSKYYVVARNLARNGKKGAAAEAYERGAINDSCVWCIYYYAEWQLHVCDSVHRAFPWYLEGAVRGHILCMYRLYYRCYGYSDTLG